MALGDAFSAGRATSDVLFYNPANLSLAGGTSTSLQRWGSASTAVSFSHAVTSNGWGIGIGFRHLDYGADSHTLPLPSELFRRGDDIAVSFAATLGLSRVIEGFRTGIAAKYVEERMTFGREGMPLFELGLGRDYGLFSLGLSVRDIGAKQMLEDVPLVPPTRASLGVTLRPQTIGAFFDASAVAEFTVDREGLLESAGGAELIWVPLDGWSIAARVGYRTTGGSGNPGGRPYSAGIGVSLDQFSLDYAMDPHRSGRVAHLLGIRMR
jgi:hypothetical protein